MNTIRLITLMILAGLTQTSEAAEAIAGYGVPYAARLVFQKLDINKNTSSNTHVFSLKTGDSLLPSMQANSNMTPATVATVKSAGWCDPLANPTPTTDIDQCYGWSQQSQWFLLDLSKLGKRKIWAEITVEKDPGINNDYLVPALTVWRGRQTQGLFGDWYPNKFQGYAANGKPDNSVSKAFWAWNLAPLNNTPDKLSWATAANNTDKSLVTLSQQVGLKGGESNYLTVIVGSDNQQAAGQNANFKLSVKLSGQQGKFDQYGCAIGLTCRHPQMDHCMPIADCSKPQYAGQCLCPK